MPELDSEAIDFRAASESFAPVRRLRRTDLEPLRLVTTHQRPKVPMVGGILLFGKDRERHFPRARDGAQGPEAPVLFDGSIVTHGRWKFDRHYYPVIAFSPRHPLFPRNRVRTERTGSTLSPRHEPS